MQALIQAWAHCVLTAWAVRPSLVAASRKPHDNVWTGGTRWSLATRRPDRKLNTRKPTSQLVGMVPGVQSVGPAGGSGRPDSYTVFGRGLGITGQCFILWFMTSFRASWREGVPE